MSKIRSLTSLRYYSLPGHNQAPCSARAPYNFSLIQPSIIKYYIHSISEGPLINRRIVLSSSHRLFPMVTSSTPPSPSHSPITLHSPRDFSFFLFRILSSSLAYTRVGSYNLKSREPLVLVSVAFHKWSWFRR